jgi:Mg2+/citrate symporter
MVPSVSPHHARSAAARAEGAARATAFWSAVALPFAAIGLLAAEAPPISIAFVLLCNAVALVVGHGHRVDATRNR